MVPGSADEEWYELVAGFVGFVHANVSGRGFGERAGFGVGAEDVFENCGSDLGGEGGES